MSQPLSGCNETVYTNSGVCHHQLSDWQQCALKETDNVFVDSDGTDVSYREEKVSMFIQIIGQMSSIQ